MNGQVVTLFKWNNKYERWEVRYSNGDDVDCFIRVRSENLKKTIFEGSARVLGEDEPLSYTYRLDQIIGNVLGNLVRGGDDMRDHEDIPQIGTGQISNCNFLAVAKVVEEFYGNTTDVLALFLDHIGKDRDSRLIQDNLKAKLAGAFQSLYDIDIMSTFTKMITIAELGTLMLNLRRWSLAFIESRLGMLATISSKLKGYKLVSNRCEVNTMMIMVMYGKDDNKSVKITSLEEELAYKENQFK